MDKFKYTLEYCGLNNPIGMSTLDFKAESEDDLLHQFEETTGLTVDLDCTLLDIRCTTPLPITLERNA